MPSCCVVGAEYGVITSLGWKSDAAMGLLSDLSAGFHTVNSYEDDNDPEAQFDPAADASDGATTKSDRHWLASGLIQYMLLSGDNEPGTDWPIRWLLALVTASEPSANGSVSIPDWFLIVLIGLIAVLRKWKSSRRARMVREQRCPTCGYDVSATPNRCPECGSIYAKETGQPA